jgi:hypothetical protein
MSGEKLKVLEMVAEGRITPEEGVRLIEALGEADRKAGGGAGSSGGGGSTVIGGQRFNPFGMGEIKIPRIDLGNLGEVLVEVKNNVNDMGKKAEATLRRSRAGRFFDVKDFPLSAPRQGDIKRAKVRFDVRAGKLRVRAAEDTAEQFIEGSIKRTPEEPSLVSEVKDGRLEAALKCSLGRGSISLHPEMSYKLQLSNSAADARLELAGLTVEELEIDNNAGSVAVELGDRVERVAVKIENNAGSLRLAVPAQYAVRFIASGNLSSHNLEKYGMELTDGTAQSGDWHDNPRGVEITLSQNVASFVLEWQRRDGVSVGYNPAQRNGDNAEVHTESGAAGFDGDPEWKDED